MSHENSTPSSSAKYASLPPKRDALSARFWPTDSTPSCGSGRRSTRLDVARSPGYETASICSGHPPNPATNFMSGKYFVDTNILVYAHDKAAGAKHERAKALVEELWSASS